MSNIYVANSTNGVYGNGINDDTAAIQALLNKAVSENGVTIEFPIGRYKLSSELIVYGNTNIRAHQSAIFDKQHNSNLMQNLQTGGQASAYNGNSNIEIDGGVYECNGTIYDGGAFAFAHAQNLHFSNMIIKNVSRGHAIEINSSKHVKVIGNQFYGYNDPEGNRNFSEAIQIDLAKDSSVLPWFGAYDNTPCVDVIIENNIFDKSDVLPGWGRAVGSHSGTIGYSHERIIVRNNIINNTLMQAIRGYGWNYCVFEGNIINNCGGGISFESVLDNGQGQFATSVVISNNNIRTGGKQASAISISGDSSRKVYEVIVEGNLIGDYVGLGIYCNYSEKVTIANNSLSGVSSTGISTANCSNLNINGNTLERISGNGLTFNSGTFGVISANLLKRVNGHGIILSTNVQGVAVNGNLLSWIGGPTNQHIRIVSSVRDFSITGNVLQDNSGQGFDSQYGIYVTSTCNNGVVSSNMAKGTGIKIENTSVISTNNIA